MIFSMSTLGERLKTALSNAGMSQSELARKINVKPQSIQYICAGKAQGTTHAVAISSVLGVSPFWLLSGNGPVQDIINHDNANLSFTDINKDSVPLISWVQAGAWSEMINNFQPCDADVHYPCPEKHSSSTFALTVVGESMYPDFIPGEIIYVDPEVQAGSGSCVVIRQNGDTEATFKQLMLDGSKKYLKALNPNWPTPIIEMLPDATICGVVIGSYRKRN